MISNDIQELLKNITKSLIKIETKELDVLISRQLTIWIILIFTDTKYPIGKLEVLNFFSVHFVALS